ncbi:MAG: lipopolysaccharide heptosyltransferase II [Candidatus Omnitrophica bacterium]|nr:lipopolysaccharide heptosyltransferase II [Candidatus Omnitrophota bacterium]
MTDRIKRPKRILIVNVNWLGDVLFSTAAIRALRRRYPDAYLACMLVPRAKQILEDNPRLNEIIVYDEKGRHRGVIGKLRFIFFLKKKRFDIVFLFQRSFTRLLLCFLAGIPQRVGYYRKKGGFLLTKKVAPAVGRIHRAEYFLRIAGEAEGAADNRGCEFFIAEEAEISMKKFLEARKVKKDNLLAVINPGGNWNLKRWPAERFARLADELIKRYSMKVIISGGPADVRLAEEIKKMMDCSPIVSCGRTNLKELAALLKFSDLVISADSGPLHITVAVGTPAIALFGPTSSDITGPFTGKTPYTVIQKDVGCEVPCYNLDCPENRCMKAITVDDVFEAAKKLIRKLR